MNLYDYKYNIIRVNIEDKELVKYLIPCWKWEKNFLFSLIVVINR